MHLHRLVLTEKLPDNSPNPGWGKLRLLYCWLGWIGSCFQLDGLTEQFCPVDVRKSAAVIAEKRREGLCFFAGDDMPRGELDCSVRVKRHAAQGAQPGVVIAFDGKFAGCF